MTLEEFDSLLGQDSYVRCLDKKRVDNAIVSTKLAKSHLFSGGQIGWWVRTGYIVVDIDEGKEEAIRIVKRLGIKTLMAKSPKGLHLYFKVDSSKDYMQRVGMILPCGLKCDFRCANKGYVILPFGTPNRKFNKVHKIAELPVEMTPMANRKDSLFSLKEGDGRNATLFAHLMAYKNHGANDEQIEEMAYIINEEVFAQPMKQKELDKIIENTHNYEAQTQGENPYLIYSAKGAPVQVNSRAIVDYFVNQGDVFVLGGECYHYRDGVYSEASSYIRNTIKDMIMVDKLITQPRIMECYRLLVDDIRLQKSATDTNRNRNLINFKNGVWDIEKQELLPHDSKYLQTLQIPHEVGLYKSFQDTKLFDFLRKTRMKNEDIKMLLRYMAYCLTLHHGLKTFMVLLGKSNTGKSVLLRFMENIVGTHNTSALSMHELNMRFYPTQLYGKLLNACGDNGSLPLSSIEMLKKITGGDQIMFEQKGNPNIFFFVPFSKLVFSFNQMPLQLEEKSNAFYKRMRILSMETELFLNDAYVNDLCENGIEEVIPYLLTLLPVKAIPRTEMSDKLVQDLREDSDSIQAFISKYCIMRKDYTVSKVELYEAYVRYCTDVGREAHKKQGFIRNMKSQGFKDGRDTATREYCWKGISLIKQRRNKK
jgi:P4 family phage/plasmid primase-like protien